jgi:hypothetical protein
MIWKLKSEFANKIRLSTLLGLFSHRSPTRTLWSKINIIVHETLIILRLRLKRKEKITVYLKNIIKLTYLAFSILLKRINN